MNLKITDLKNTGLILNDEQVEISVLANTNLKRYALVDNTYLNGKVSNIHPHFYQLPDIDVRAGDKVVVHTGVGEYHPTRRLLGQTMTFHVYIGSKAPIWNNTGDTAWLYKIELESVFTKPKSNIRYAVPKPFKF